MRASQSFTTTGPGGVRLLTVHVEPVAAAVRLRAVGELDLFTVPTLREAFAGAWAMEPADVAVDLTEVDFLSVSAAASLVRARHEADARCVSMHVLGRPGIVEWVLAAAGRRQGAVG